MGNVFLHLLKIYQKISHELLMSSDVWLFNELAELTESYTSKFRFRLIFTRTNFQTLMPQRPRSASVIRSTTTDLQCRPTALWCRARIMCTVVQLTTDLTCQSIGILGTKSLENFDDTIRIRVWISWNIECLMCEWSQHIQDRRSFTATLSDSVEKNNRG